MKDYDAEDCERDPNEQLILATRLVKSADGELIGEVSSEGLEGLGMSLMTPQGISARRGANTKAAKVDVQWKVEKDDAKEDAYRDMEYEGWVKKEEPIA